MKQLHQLTALSSVLVLGVSSLVACSSDDPGTGGNTGGFLGSGGVTGTGAVPNGGTTTTGGAGGGPATGGVTGTTGGVTGTTGGVTGTTGGATGNGGATASGGATGNGGTTGSGGGGGGACDQNGTYAILFQVGVKWDATIGVDAGSGNQELILLSNRTYDAATKKVTDQARICSVKIPGFHSGLFGDITVTFPTATFDKVAVTQTLLSTLGAAPAAGTTFSSDPNAIVVGATLANAATATWPATASIQSVDVETDTHKGITADGTNVPTDILGTKADKLYLAFRTVAAVTGKMDTCDKSSGTIDLKSINQSIMGCHLAGGAECGTDAANFVDTQSPKWTTSGSSKLSMVKLAASATCVEARAAAF